MATPRYASFNAGTIAFLRELKANNNRDWFNEKTPRPATLFSWTRPSESVDRQTQYDFIPMGITGGPFTRVLGLEPSLFPRLPDFPIESESDERPCPSRDR